ncbi:MAG: flagellin [Bdellovibrionales bacterium]
MESLETIDEGLYKVLDARSTFGAAQSRFQYTIDNLSNQHQNISEARSIIADVDVAEEAANFAKSQILQELSTSVLMQANHSHERALRLLVDL